VPSLLFAFVVVAVAAAARCPRRRRLFSVVGFFFAFLATQTKTKAPI